MVIAEYIKISDQFLSGLVPVFNIMEQVNSANTTANTTITVVNIFQTFLATLRTCIFGYPSLFIK